MQTLRLRALRGRPIVIVRDDRDQPETGLACDTVAIRGELRGLGAVLVVRVADAAWLLRPDDPMEGCDATDDLRGLDEETGGADLVVLDPEGLPCYSRSRVPREDLASGLLSALRTARRTFTLGPSFPRSVSRRQWLVTAMVSSFAAVFLDACASSPRAAVGVTSPQPPSREPAGGYEMDIVLQINGRDRPARVDTRTSLLDALRERLALSGTKKGCDHGQCGACTVLLDDRRVNACLVLAVMAQGAKITTIEGLADGDRLHPMQAAFLAEDGLQCGYCTPGQIVSAVGLLSEGTARSDDEVREMMSGNLCRCGAYPNIVRAIQRARGA